MGEGPFSRGMGTTGSERKAPRTVLLFSFSFNYIGSRRKEPYWKGGGGVPLTGIGRGGKGSGARRNQEAFDERVGVRGGRNGGGRFGKKTSIRNWRRALNGKRCS